MTTRMQSDIRLRAQPFDTTCRKPQQCHPMRINRFNSHHSAQSISLHLQHQNITGGNTTHACTLNHCGPLHFCRGAPHPRLLAFFSVFVPQVPSSREQTLESAPRTRYFL
ncbi:hypothetical protein GGI42DRAFT_6111 [Trichoderma sp. SZMC 28013]